MKRCPECRRDYFDESLLYCLDDGSALLDGPASDPAASVGGHFDEPQTAILHETVPPKEAATRAQIHTTERTGVFPGGAADMPVTKGFDNRLLLGPFALAVIVLGGFFGYRYFSGTDSGQINSIAVLPFENRSSSPDSEYLSDGLAESLIYRLSQLPGLKVSPTNAVLRYKGSQPDIAAIANELDVDAVVSGRLVQRADDLTISVELTNARTNKLIWAEQYARKMSDLLAMQREIASTVTEKMQLKLSSNEAALTKQYTNDNEAYQLYLKGRFFWNKRTSEGIRTAVEHFKAAAEKDPNFALAYVGLADSSLVGLYSTRNKEKEVIPIAKAYAARALEIDPSLAEAHATLGLAYTLSLDWPEAENHLVRATELNPRYPSARHWHSRLLRSLGRFDEALEQIQQAKKDDELSSVISNNVAESLFEKGDVSAAIEETRRGIEITPMWPLYRTLTYCYLRLGQKEDALASAKKTAEFMDGSPVTLKVLGYVQAAIGNRDEAQAIVKVIEDKYAKGEADGRDVAVVYAGLGDNNKVFAWLEKDLQSRNSSLCELRHEVPFMPLRNDPRFKDLLKRAGLPE